MSWGCGAVRTVTEGLGLDVTASFFNRCFGLLQPVLGAFPGSFHQLLHLQAKIQEKHKYDGILVNV